MDKEDSRAPVRDLENCLAQTAERLGLDERDLRVWLAEQVTGLGKEMFKPGGGGGSGGGSGG
eukprot:CAMPEP_0172589432 /NCGR_PEP_ID=MMETSP1068-20121228/8173_1 /TAXON_ID=35684 /ORGANISM="Pseudopedinella elastica, Strain CCMP716" /LENGTH=61 /DNA_ID=CAMNT_0013385037 /DNA_START=48 /DNA_END=229 /DNA_ORIENTATION=-